MSNPVVLTSKLDLSAASGMANAFRENTDAEVVVDFSEVKLLGALCLQVLLSAATSLNGQGRKLQLTNVPERVLEQMRVMGMTPEDITRGRQ